MQQHFPGFQHRLASHLVALVVCVGCDVPEDRFAPFSSDAPTSNATGIAPSASSSDNPTTVVRREADSTSPQSAVTSSTGGLEPTRPLPIASQDSSVSVAPASAAEQASFGATSSDAQDASRTEVPSDDETASDAPNGEDRDALPELPDPGDEGDGAFELGPSYSAQRELSDLGAPKGRRFEFSMRLADSRIFDGKDPTLNPAKRVNLERSIVVYVPARFAEETPAPLLVIQDGPGDIALVQNALDNLTISNDATRRLPAFVAIAVQNGGDDAQGSQRGLEYDTMSDRYARFIEEEVLPAVLANPAIASAYPKLQFTKDPSGRASLGCSSGGAAALTMGWFRPDLFSRIITYSGTFVDQQNHDAPEVATYPDGAWGYHSNQRLIQTHQRKPLRIFLNVNENDLRADDPESTLHNWVLANQRTAAALEERGYHYRYVFGRGVGHCDGSIRRATLADALVWVWRGYEGPQRSN